MFSFPSDAARGLFNSLDAYFEFSGDLLVGVAFRDQLQKPPLRAN